MRSSGIAGVDAKTYFRDIREEGIKKLAVVGVSIWYATTGAREYLFSPPGMIIRDSVMDHGCSGMRYAMVAPGDTEGLKSFKDMADLKNTPADHPAKGVVAWVERCKKMA